MTYTLQVGSYTVANVPYTSRSSNVASSSYNYSSVMQPVTAKLLAKEITLNGVDLEKRLAKIEERLAILNTDPALEERWESLRDLGKKYKALEKVAMESETILKKLTGDEKI